MDPISRPASTAAEAESSPLCTPILGLKCAEQKGEQWFENYHRSAAAKSNWEVCKCLEWLQPAGALGILCF